MDVNEPQWRENLRYHAAFLLMGFSFTVLQALMIRALLVAYYGNELSIGLVLGNWLLLEAIGSGIIGDWLLRKGQNPVFSKKTGFLTENWAIAALQVALAVLLPLSLYAAYTVRQFIGALPGAGLSLGQIFYTSLLVLAPIGVIDGVMFTACYRAYARVRDERRASNTVYVLEAVGGIIGGVVFTYLLIPYLTATQMALLVSALNLLAANSFVTRRRRQIVSYLLILIFISFLATRSAEIHNWLARRQWANYDLLAYRDSYYGNVAVIEQARQYTFFAGGIPILTAPVPDIAAVEEIVHLPMLFASAPRRVLVISGGVGGVIAEILKYPVDRVDYAELDPLLIEMAREFPTDLTASELSDPRVHVHTVDGRLLVQQVGAAQYDLIIINLPYPITLQLNRFYTVEFFRAVRGIMSDAGVLVIGIPGSVNYLSAEMRALNGLLAHTLAQIFPHIRPIPDETTWWLASPGAAVEELSTDDLLARWREREIAAQMVNEVYLELKFNPARLARFTKSLSAPAETGPQEQEINADLRPLGLFYGLSYWNAMFAPQWARVFARLGQLQIWHIALILAGLPLLAIGARWGRKRAVAVPYAIVTTGFAGMTGDLLIIFAFQSLYGYVYQQVGLLTAAFMAGLTLGGIIGNRTVGANGRSPLQRAESALVGFWVLLPLILRMLYGADIPTGALSGILLLLNAMCGALVGLEFPLANALYSAARGGAGALYAYDLAGAFAAAMLVAVVLAPLFGLVITCLIVAALKVGSWGVTYFAFR